MHEPMLVPRGRPDRTPASLGVEPAPAIPWPINADDTFALNDLYATVQGEGVKAGVPMTIVRLQGCPVGCVFCDTPESWALADKRVTAAAIADRVAQMRPRWALVTGGEPTWHRLDVLTRALRASSYTALETSGVFPITGEWNWITLSPKPRGRMPLLPVNVALANEVKWLVGRRSDVDDLRAFEQAHSPWRATTAIVVQPISCSPAATALCVDAVQENPHWRLSLQTHKLLGIA